MQKLSVAARIHEHRRCCIRKRKPLDMCGFHAGCSQLPFHKLRGIVVPEAAE